jgi:hypothetical protein
LPGKVVLLKIKRDAIMFPMVGISVLGAGAMPVKKTLYEKSVLPEIGVNSKWRRNAHNQKVPFTLAVAPGVHRQPVRGGRDDL